MKKRVLSCLLAVVLCVSMLAMPASAYVVTFLPDVPVVALNTGTTHKYNIYWQYWMQGASAHNIMRMYGCRVVAQAKMLMELGLASQDVNTFNPDIYLAWGRANGYWPYSDNDINEQTDSGLAACTYAAQYGITLNRGIIALSGTNSEADSQLIMDYIEAGHYVILHSAGHQAYVGHVASLDVGRPVVLDSWNDYSVHPSANQTYGPEYTNGKFTHMYVFLPQLSTTATAQFTQSAAHSIGTTNAVLGTDVTISGVPSGGARMLTVWLMDTQGNLLAARSKIPPSYTNPFTVNFDVNNDVFYTLTPGVTYQYRFCMELYGSQFLSEVMTFTAGGGTHTHSYGTWMTTTAATCTSAGEQRRSCSCGAYETCEIPALNHSPGQAVEENRVEPSGGTDGKYDSVVYCSRCGVELSRTMVTIPADKATIVRLSGRGRCETAIMAADQLKAALRVDTFDHIIIASGTNFADALAGSYLANRKGAPILLYLEGNEALNEEYIKANLSADGEVYLLGGTAAIPQSVEDSLKRMGIDVERLSGRSRFETNLAILGEAGLEDDMPYLVCTGYNFADSLSASAVGAPILMVDTNTDKLSESQKEFLRTMGQHDIIILGGTGAVSDDLLEELKDFGNVNGRISGKTRYETSVNIAKATYDVTNTVVIASGANFPDGLCGGPLAYAMGAPLVLTAAKSETAAAAYVDENPITTVYVMGGTSALSDDTIDKVISQD